jgi:GT2 family glycosyltransferase
VTQTARPRVAVIIVTYRSYAELRQCLASLAREAAETRILVVDHDGDPLEVEALARDYPWARVLVAGSNSGFAAGVNRGAGASESDYLLLLNPDSIVQPGLCGTLARWMDAHPDVAVVGPLIRNADGSVQASARRFPDLTTAVAGRSSWLTRVLPGNPLSRRNLPYTNLASGQAVDVDWVSGACMMIRRHAFDQVGGMDSGFFLYWEDADFCKRASLAGWRTSYLPVPGAMHIGGASSRHASDSSLVAFHRSAYRLFRKHASRPRRLLSPFVWFALRLRLAFMRRLTRARARHEAVAHS